jgi:CRP-like cAMP-binding protein
MNRFGFCKQEGPVFRIRDLNSPWRSVLHLGQRQMVGKSYQWEDDPETSTFSFLEKGRVRLLNLSETGKERIVLYIEPGCLFREIVLLHVSPSHPASLVALESCEVYNFPRTLLDDAEFVRRHPALMSNLVHSLGAKAGAFYSQITESVELDPQTQVCRYLHRLADERRTRVVNPGVSQSELALVLGLHRSTVCRIIRTLRDRGVLGHFTRCSLEILDREALAELCNPSEGGK